MVFLQKSPHTIGHHFLYTYREQGLRLSYCSLKAGLSILCFPLTRKTSGWRGSAADLVLTTDCLFEILTLFYYLFWDWCELCLLDSFCTLHFVIVMNLAPLWILFCLMAFVPGSNCWTSRQNALIYCTCKSTCCYARAPAATMPYWWAFICELTCLLLQNAATWKMARQAEERQEKAGSKRRHATPTLEMPQQIPIACHSPI